MRHPSTFGRDYQSGQRAKTHLKSNVEGRRTPMLKMTPVMTAPLENYPYVAGVVKRA